jgi:ferric-dicitrate binding protein FerR (iron transport regulator)
MKKSVLGGIIEKFLNKESSEKEKILLDRFYESFDDENVIITPEEKQNIQNEIINGIRTNIGDFPRSKRKIKSGLVYAAASVALMCVIAGGILYKTGFFNSRTIPVNWTEKATVNGEKASIKLSDGTDITLNAASKLNFPDRFSSAAREVYLEGEAFFDVAKDSSKPFTIHSGEIKVTVLGTKFNISSFKDDDDISVTLIEGKVKVANENAPGKEGIVILQPSQQLIYNKKDSISEVVPFDQQKEIGWKENLLKFEKEPLVKIFPVLERTYGVKFELANVKLANQKITVNFKNESFWTVAAVLKNLTGMQYRTVKEKEKVVKIVFYNNK